MNKVVSKYEEDFTPQGTILGEENLKYNPEAGVLSNYSLSSEGESNGGKQRAGSYVKFYKYEEMKERFELQSYKDRLRCKLK